MKQEFIEFRNSVIKSFLEHEVHYKLFGGAVVCLINEKRETVDLDIMIKTAEEEIEKICKALSSIDYDTYENLKDELHDGPSAGYRLKPTKPEWSEFYIDLLFDLSIFDYNNLKSHEIEDNGIKINAVTYSEIIRMKNRVLNRQATQAGKAIYEPRPQDKADIEFLSKTLNLDPKTGEPLDEFSSSNSFGGGSHD
jgi:hypothetical protein